MNTESKRRHGADGTGIRQAAAWEVDFLFIHYDCNIKPTGKVGSECPPYRCHLRLTVRGKPYKVAGNACMRKLPTVLNAMMGATTLPDLGRPLRHPRKRAVEGFYRFCYFCPTGLKIQLLPLLQHCVNERPSEQSPFQTA